MRNSSQNESQNSTPDSTRTRSATHAIWTSTSNLCWRANRTSRTRCCSRWTPSHRDRASRWFPHPCSRSTCRTVRRRRSTQRVRGIGPWSQSLPPSHGLWRRSSSCSAQPPAASCRPPLPFLQNQHISTGGAPQGSRLGQQLFIFCRIRSSFKIWQQQKQQQ